MYFRPVRHSIRSYLQQVSANASATDSLPLAGTTFSLDGLMEHDTKLDLRICWSDTHGHTKLVMAALLEYELAPRIKDIKDQTFTE